MALLAVEFIDRHDNSSGNNIIAFYKKVLSRQSPFQNL
jgi:hypothetical protein